MTPDLSYYWEGAREWCGDNKSIEEKRMWQMYTIIITASKKYFNFYEIRTSLTAVVMVETLRLLCIEGTRPISTT